MPGATGSIGFTGQAGNRGNTGSSGATGATGQTRAFYSQIVILYKSYSKVQLQKHYFCLLRTYKI